MKEWFTAAELASRKLSGLPHTKSGIIRRAKTAGWQRPDRRWPLDPEGLWRRREGRGGGIEYHLRVLPEPARARLAMAEHLEAAKAEQEAAANRRAAAKEELTRESIWDRYARLPDVRKAVAAERLAALDAVETLAGTGLSRQAAMLDVAAQRGVAARTLYNWSALVSGVPRCDWLAWLVPRHVGAVGRRAACDEPAWEFLLAAWLRQSRPSFESTYRALQTVAATRGWRVAPARTMQRWANDIERRVRILGREGEGALKRAFPAQERDRTGFHALEAVNADGHRWDVMVRWPEVDAKGRPVIARPVMLAFQDLHSNYILSWRIDRSEHRELVRLAFGDMVEAYGIPEKCWFDNGRAFAAKWLTGRAPWRHRFKILDEEPVGILTQLGVEIHWTTPYSGQSKPIERAFRDLADTVARDPRFEHAYVGNRPDARPEDFDPGRAVDLETFVRVVSAGIAEHNRRVGRETAAAKGRSFEQTFLASYHDAANLIRRPTDEQRRLWLMAAESVRVRRDATIELMGNRYHDERLIEHAHEKLVVRFDPQSLHDKVHAYRLDGAFIATADCIEAVGFADIDAARERAACWARYRKATQAAKAALQRMDQATIRALRDEADAAQPPPPAVEAKVVRGAFRNFAPQAAQAAAANEEQEQQERVRTGIRNFLQLVRTNENDADRE